MRCGRIAFLEMQLREALDLSDALLESGDGGPSVAAKKLAVDLRAELDKLRAFERDRKKKRTPLEEARAMRQRADASGSHVAARDMFRLELELMAKVDAEAREAEAARLAHLEETEIVQMLVESLLSLPGDLRDRVRDAVYAQVH